MLISFGFQRKSYAKSLVSRSGRGPHRWPEEQRAEQRAREERRALEARRGRVEQAIRSAGQRAVLAQQGELLQAPSVWICAGCDAGPLIPPHFPWPLCRANPDQGMMSAPHIDY